MALEQPGSTGHTIPDRWNNPGKYEHAPPLYSEKIYSGNKTFFLDLKENHRGRFAKITEDVRGRRDSIILPAEALDEFIDALNRVADFEDDLENPPAQGTTLFKGGGRGDVV